MKDKVIGIIIGLISGIIIFISIINMFLLYFGIIDYFVFVEKIFAWIGIVAHKIIIVAIISTMLFYTKWKKSITIIILSISILSFIIPIRKVEEWKNINNNPGIGLFPVAGIDKLEKYEMYYNIYDFTIKEKATGEIEYGPK